MIEDYKIERKNDETRSVVKRPADSTTGKMHGQTDTTCGQTCTTSGDTSTTSG